MKDNELDELFRSGLANDYPVDPTLWSALEPKLPAPAKGGGAWVFILNGIAILSVLFFGNYVSKNSFNLKASNHLKQTEETNESNQIVLLDNPIASNKIIVANKINTNQSAEINSDPEVILNDVESKRTKTNSSSSNRSESSFNSEEISSSSTNFSVGVNTEKIGPQVVNTLSLQEIPIDKKKSRSVNPMAAARLEPIEEFDLLIPNSLLLPLSELDDVALLSLQKNTNHLYKPIKRIQFSQLELVYSRSFFTNKKVSRLDEKTVSFKSRAEQKSNVFTIGINILNQYKWFTYGFGVHYFKQEERVRYQIVDGEIRDVITYDTTYNVLDRNYTSNGHPVLLIQNQINEITTPTFVQFDNYLVGTNSFERIQIPVFVGATKRINNWIGEIRTGFVANYALNQQGAYINEDLNGLVRFDEKKLFNDFILGQTNSLSLGYQLNESLSLGLRMNYEYDLSSITTDYSSRLNTARGAFWLLFRPR